MEQHFDIQSVTPAQVVKVYSGRPGCACGCRGKYWTNETSKAMVTKVLRTIQAWPDRVKMELGGSCEWIEVDLGRRVFVAYLRDE